MELTSHKKDIIDNNRKKKLASGHRAIHFVFEGRDSLHGDHQTFYGHNLCGT